MSNRELITKIKRVEKIASVSRIKRMLMNPYKYLNAIFFREFIYKKTKKEKEVICKTFFHTKMHLLLPSGTDIYLTGGKSHDSEIRLAKFLINQLRPNDTFIDVGAHYGYFTLLASKLVGSLGKVIAFEASPNTYGILKKNTSINDNIVCYNLAVSDTNDELVLFEFPNLYSEYSTIDIDQFKNENWFLEYKPMEVKVNAIILRDYIVEESIVPKIIKIDVEGAEYKVITGFRDYLGINSPIIIMEYLSIERGNKEHIKAENLITSFGYNSYIIDQNGEPVNVESISDSIQNRGLESDNIAFMKSEKAGL